MTDEAKKELIKRYPDMTPAEVQALPSEARDFLNGPQDQHDADLYSEVWSEKPFTLEHAVVSAACTAEEIRTAAKVLREVWDTWTASGVHATEQKATEARELIEVIEWRARTWS